MFWGVLYYLVHLGPFGCLMKLGAKRAELVQKFVPRSRVEIFGNEYTGSIPLDPKQMFWCVSYYLGAFGTVWLPYETRCKTGRTSAKSSCDEVALKFFATNAPDPPHWTLNSGFGAFHTIWVHLGPFGCIKKTRGKTSQTSAKVRVTKSLRNFSQRMHPFHPIGP